VFVDNLIWQNLSIKDYALWLAEPYVGHKFTKSDFANRINGICGHKTKPLIGLLNLWGFFCV
jgi:hypothetical protein